MPELFYRFLFSRGHGDYWAGPSHVLPTGRSARFSSGLSVYNFMKRSSLIQLTPQAFNGVKNRL